jgi:ABC-type glycerol-3-phosphate transport system substrate-binding protein
MRRLNVLAILVAAVLLVAACTPGVAPSATAEPTNAAPAITTEPARPATVGIDAASIVDTTPASQVVTISFATAPEMLAIYEPLVASFQQANPGISVQLVDNETLITPVVTNDGTITSDQGSLREILSGADAADVSPTPEAIAKGWVADLQPLMDADPAFDRDDFNPGALDAYGHDGHAYLAPSFMWVGLLSYNKDLWARRGLPAPDPAWSWQDLKAAAEQLVHRRGTTIDVYGMLDWDGGYRAMLAELADAKATVGPAQAARLDRPDIATALEQAAALVRSGAIYQPQGAWGSPDEYRDAILAQHVALWPADVLDAGARPSFPVGSVPFPGTSIGVGGFVMSAGTQHANETWRWIAFLSHQSIAWPFGGPGPVPARKSVAEHSGYWSRLDPDAAAATRAALGRPPAPLLPEFDPRSFVLLRRALAEVAGGQKTATEALHDAQADLEQQLAQAPVEPTPATDHIVVEPPAVAAPGATTIVFAAPGGGQDPIARVARAFNEQNNGVFVQLKHINLPGGGTHIAEIASQSDCFMGDGPPQPDDRPAVLDLQPLLDADPTFARDDYPRVLVAPFQDAGKLYGLPHAVDFRVLHYNQTLFDGAGIAHPTGAWTLDDLARAAQSLTRGPDSARQYGFASTILQWRDVFFFLDRQGASATTGSGDMTQPNFTDPNVAQAIRAYLDLLRAASPHRRLTGYTNGEAVDTNAIALVGGGRVGMWFDFGAFGTSAGRFIGFAHAIAPPPLASGPLTSNDFRETGLYIATKTQHPEACWAWLKALSADITALRGAFPARTSLSIADAFAAQAPPGAADVYRAYRQAFERTPANTPPQPTAAQSPVDFYWFFRAIDRALQGKNLDRELEDAQALTEQFLACVRTGASGSDCAQQIDPQYAGWRNVAR